MISPPPQQELEAFKTYPVEILPAKVYMGNYAQACDSQIQKDLKIKAHINISEEAGVLWVCSPQWQLLKTIQHSPLFQSCKRNHNRYLPVHYFSPGYYKAISNHATEF